MTKQELQEMRWRRAEFPFDREPTVKELVQVAALLAAFGALVYGFLVIG